MKTRQTTRRAVRGVVLAITIALAATALAAGGASATVATPFDQCPAIGASPSCGVVIEFTDGGINFLVDPSVAPYDGIEDTLVGVVNHSSAPVNRITLSGIGSEGTPIFALDEDGLCSTGLFPGFPAPSGCPFGPTGYEGPGTSFANISHDARTGDVVFTGGLAPGASTYFSLEDNLVPSLITFISLTPPAATNPLGTTHTVTATVKHGDGTALAGVPVTFAVTGGPDAGVGGTCVPSSCATDANGQVSFTYRNVGVAGTDTITASFVNASGAVQSASAAKTWIPSSGTPCAGGSVNVRWHYSANGTSGSWSGTKSTDCANGSVTIGPQAMEGDLKLSPGTTLLDGYSFTVPGNKRTLTARVTNATVVFTVGCVTGTPLVSTWTVPMPDATYTVAGSAWVPSGDQKNVLVYQGTAVVPSTLCSGGQVRLNKGGTFSATILFV